MCCNFMQCEHIGGNNFLLNKYIDFLHLAKTLYTSASATSLTVTTMLINYAYSCNISVNYLRLKTENVFYPVQHIK